MVSQIFSKLFCYQRQRKADEPIKLKYLTDSKQTKHSARMNAFTAHGFVEHSSAALKFTYGMQLLRSIALQNDTDGILSEISSIVYDDENWLSGVVLTAIEEASLKLVNQDQSLDDKVNTYTNELHDELKYALLHTNIDNYNNDLLMYLVNRSSTKVGVFDIIKLLIAVRIVMAFKIPANPILYNDETINNEADLHENVGFFKYSNEEIIGTIVVLNNIKSRGAKMCMGIVEIIASLFDIMTNNRNEFWQETQADGECQSLVEYAHYITRRSTSMYERWLHGASYQADFDEHYVDETKYYVNQNALSRLPANRVVYGAIRHAMQECVNAWGMLEEQPYAELQDVVNFGDQQYYFLAEAYISTIGCRDDDYVDPLQVFDTISDRGYKDTVVIPTAIIVVILVSVAVLIIYGGLSKASWMSIDGVDPTSLASLTLAIEGILLAAYVSMFKDNWSWYDMMRGQLYVEDYYKTSEKFRKRYPPIIILRHIYKNIDFYRETVNHHGLCLSKSRCNGKIFVPLMDGYNCLEAYGIYVSTIGNRMYVVNKQSDTGNAMGDTAVRKAITTDSSIYHIYAQATVSWEYSAIPPNNPIIGINIKNTQPYYTALGINSVSAPDSVMQERDKNIRSRLFRNSYWRHIYINNDIYKNIWTAKA